MNHSAEIKETMIGVAAGVMAQLAGENGASYKWMKEADEAIGRWVEEDPRPVARIESVLTDFMVWWQDQAVAADHWFPVTGRPLTN